MAATKKTQKQTKPTPTVVAQAAPKAAPPPEPPATPAPAPAAATSTPAPAAPQAQPAPVPGAKPKAKPAKQFADIDVKAVGASVIKVLTRNPDGSIKNPKVAGGAPAKRFAKYADGMTVSAALAAGVTEADVRWDVAHEYIALQ